MAYGKKSYRKSSRTRKYASKSRKGLTKTEKTQVKSITKRAMNVMIESKYFDTASHASMSFNPSWIDGIDISEISCLGFTTGIENSRNTTDARAFQYGTALSSQAKVNMTSLDMNKLFLDTNGVPQLARQTLEGATCRPAFNESQWLLNRIAGDTDDTVDPPYKLQNALPYVVRMLRLRPRSLKGSYINVDPQTDAFLTSKNVEFGIATVNNSFHYWNEFEFHLAKANSRKYQIIEDKFITCDSQMNFYNAGQVTGAPGPTSTTQSKCGIKKFSCKHKLGTEFHYTDPQSTPASAVYPDDGFIPEFVLFHIIATGNPAASANKLPPNGMRLSVRPVSTFKDA